MSLGDGYRPNLQNGTIENPDNLLKKYEIKDLVTLPTRENTHEWIAFNIFNFHKQICMLYGTINEHCTAEKCPRMSAGKKYEFLWSSRSPRRESIELCATQYIHYLLDWVQEQLDDETVFPTESKNRFPDDYIDTCKAIVKRLFRVYAHIYHHHMEEVRALGEGAHMNTSLKHFTYFAQEFNLVSDDDLEPLKEYIQSFT